MCELEVHDVTGNSLGDIHAKALEAAERLFDDGRERKLAARVVGLITSPPPAHLNSDKEFHASFVRVTEETFH
ncbi:hypothetical protein ACQEU6_27475 [Spirillospora sp. CA-108201]